MRKYQVSVETSVDLSVGQVFNELGNKEKMAFVVEYFNEDLFDDQQFDLLKKCFNCMGESDQIEFVVDCFDKKFGDDLQEKMFVGFFEYMSRLSQQNAIEKIVGNMDSMQKAELRKLLED